MRLTASKNLTVVAFLSIFMGSANAAISPNNAVVNLSDSGVIQKKEQKIAICVFGVCVNIPNPPMSIPSQTSGNSTDSTKLSGAVTWALKGCVREQRKVNCIFSLTSTGLTQLAQAIANPAIGIAI